MELERDDYDVVVIGTGLAESIAAAALAKAGKSVLHLDPNPYYGGEEASLTLDELQEWCQERSSHLTNPESSSSAAGPSSSSSSGKGTYHQNQKKRYTESSSTEPDESLLANKRRYALSLFPAVLPSRGSLITTLINSGVSKYVSFRLLDSVSLYDEALGSVRRVPGSKEQVFKDKEISLMEKRRLMKFLMFAVGDFENDQSLKGKEKEPFIDFLQTSFSLSPNMAAQVAFAIAHCSSTDDQTLNALERTRRYLKSIGRYGSGAFLVAQYGGAGEIAQGFCRACAVFGGTYVLGPESIPESIEVEDVPEGGVKIKIPCHPRTITAKHLITSPDHLPSGLASDTSSTGTRKTAHCIAILSERPDVLSKPEIVREEPSEDDEEEVGEDDTAVIVFPPTAGEDGTVVRAFMMGEGTGSCPNGQYIMYLSREIKDGSDPKSALQSYLNRLSPSPLFESYYTSSSTRDHTVPPTQSPSPAIVLLNPYPGSETLTEGLDWEAEQGEKAFWAVMGGQDDVEDGRGFFDRTEADEPGDEDEL